MAKQTRSRSQSRSSRAKQSYAKPTSTQSTAGSEGRCFGEPQFEPDKLCFKDQRPDVQYYKMEDKKLLPVPRPRTETPIMLLDDILEKSEIQKIRNAGRIVFHSVGDTGVNYSSAKSVSKLKNEDTVVDKMVEDFNENNSADVPKFLFHLGDVVYSFGENQYYYDQFYEPFRNYQAPIFAIPGNHDGLIYTRDPEQSLEAFKEHFCSETPTHSPHAGGLARTTMTQPGVYFTLEAPLVTIIGLYSNVLEDPGVISSEGGQHAGMTDDQKNFLKNELKRLADQDYAGAVILAVHHPPFTGGTAHGGSPKMLKDIDDAIKYAGGFAPHAVLSGHAHNYQRFTRQVGGKEIPFIIAGSGGHNVTHVKSGKGKSAIRVPVKEGDHAFVKYMEEYGYLRIVVTQKLMSIEFHDIASGLRSKSPADICTVDLKARRLTLSHA